LINQGLAEKIEPESKERTLPNSVISIPQFAVFIGDKLILCGDLISAFSVSSGILPQDHVEVSFQFPDFIV
jgi:hypothetical protein